MTSVRLRPRAKNDIQSIILYIGEVLHSPKAAKKFYDDFCNEVERIKNNPGLGERFDNPLLGDTAYRWVTIGKYKVFYRCDKGVLMIWRVTHCSQDIDDFELIDWAG